MRRLVIPVMLVVIPVAIGSCNPSTAGDSAATDVLTDAAAADAQCTFDPERPASDPCMGSNLGGQFCAWNRTPDGAVECILV